MPAYDKLAFFFGYWQNLGHGIIFESSFTYLKN